MPVHRSTKHACTAALVVILCICLFCVPLWLKRRVYRDTWVSLTTSDVAPVTQRMSSVWCSAQTLSAADRDTSFEAYTLDHLPSVLLDNETVKVEFVHFSRLRVAQVEYWGFYLFKGSRMKVSTCSRLPGATLTILRGQRVLQDCLKTFREKDSILSAESEESLSEDKVPSSSISSSEGVFSLESAEGSFRCPAKSLRHRSLNSSFSCFSDVIAEGRIPRYLDSVTLEAVQTGHHYLVFSSGAVLDLMPNEVRWTLRLWKTQPDLGSSLRNCSSETGGSCRMDLDFASGQVTLVRMCGRGNGSTPLSDVVRSTCEPRKGLFFVFFFLLFLTVGLCAFQ